MKSLRVLIPSLLLVLCASGIAPAEVPRSVSYSGLLTDTAGAPVADGAHLVKFTIYDAETGGNVIWDAGFQMVNTINGLFSYQLGSQVPFPANIFADSARYLGVTYSTDPEMTPRVRLTSQAYAFHSLKADTAGFASSAAVADDAALLNGNPGSFYNSWSNLTGVPPGFADNVDDVGLGDITSVNTGIGLLGGAEIGAVTLQADTTFLQARVTGTAPAGSAITGINSDGSVSAAPFGDITGVTPGSGLSGGGGSGNVILEVASDGITADHIATGAVGTSEIADFSVFDIDIADEPGVSHAFMPGNNIPLVGWASSNTGDDVYIGQTINCPTSGFVVAFATGYWKLSHTQGVTEFGRLTLGETGDNTQVDFDNSAFIEIPSGAASGDYQSTWAITKVTAVSSGNYTVYLRGACTATGTVILERPHLTLMFFPTAYGSVANSAPPSAPPPVVTPDGR